MDTPWWVYLILGILLYTAITNFEGLRTNFLNANVESVKKIVTTITGWFKGTGTTGGGNQTIGSDLYIGKPDCKQDADCNLEACNNQCLCNVGNGQCYIPGG